MADGLTPLVAFPLVAFAALAVPSAIAYVLFGIVRKDSFVPVTRRHHGPVAMTTNRASRGSGRPERRFR